MKTLTTSKTYIIIYGKNSNDNTINAKYNSLISLGFKNVYVYTGGLFEWLCLQDIYGSDSFPTTSKELDLLKFKSNKDRNIIIESQETYLNDEFNTIYQSAEKLQKLMNENAGVVIEVKKNIPTGSGLGGASSNAASTLVALNKLWRLNLNKRDLIKIASSIGADVPFFVYGKNASGEGIGDKLEENKTTSKKNIGY